MLAGDQNPVDGVVPQHVMFVDDDADLLDAAGQLLRSHGYEITTCRSGAEALAVLSWKRLPEVIVLDLHLPTMNGWEIRLALLANRSWAHIPVLIMSGDSSPAARAIRADVHLAKPVAAQRLLRAIGEATRRHAHARRFEDNYAQTVQATELLGHITGQIAEDLDQLSRELSTATHHCDALEPTLSAAQRRGMSSARRILENCRATAATLFRVARATKAAADDVLDEARTSRGPDDEPLH